MRTPDKPRPFCILVSEEDHRAIKDRARREQKTVTEYLVGCALEGDDACEPSGAARDVGTIPTDAEQAAWNRFNVDNVQLLRRVTVLVKMVRFMIGRHLGVPEAEVDKLIRQYSETTRVDFLDRPDVFPAQDRGLPMIMQANFGSGQTFNSYGQHVYCKAQGHRQ